MEQTSEAPAAVAGPSARDARRRKILERSTDRLAFITGQTRSVAPPPADVTPPPPPPPTPVPDQKQPPSAEPVIVSHKSQSTILKYDTRSVAAKNVSDMGIGVDPSTVEESHPQSSEPKTSATAERMAIPSVGERKYSHRDDVRHHTAPGTFQQVFTPNRITYCVAATENIRLLCAVVIALLVASSYRGSSFGGMLASGLRCVGPLYVVLLTDVAIVTGMLLTYDVPDKDENEKRTSRHEFDLAKVLELGLVVYRTSKAVFMDCCVCAVIMIIALPYSPRV